MKVFRALIDTLLPIRATYARVVAADEHELLPLMTPSTQTQDMCTYVSLLPFRHPLVRACIHEVKYHDNAKAARMLGVVLATYLRTIAIDSILFIVPIPLSRIRQKERGYNQVARVARAACTHLAETAVLSPTLLLRTRHSVSQTQLSRKQRLTNMHAAFTLEAPLPTDATLVLVDDVATTGATLAAALEGLGPAGSCTIVAVALAH